MAADAVGPDAGRAGSGQAGSGQRSVEVSWLDAPGREVREQLAHLVAVVAAGGGAVGWLHVPDRAEVDAWLDGSLAAGARIVVARLDGVVVGTGQWAWQPEAVLRHNGHVAKVMTLPQARGRGVARAVTAALVADAERAGVELLTLECRGNNHAALALYASLGFVVTGRRPEAIAVGDERFDQVLLHLDLRERRPPDHALVRRGSRREGTGAT